MYISAGRKTLIEVSKDIEVLEVHEKYLNRKKEAIEARIGIHSSMLGDRIQGSIEPDDKIINYIAEKEKIREELENVRIEKEELKAEKRSIEGILRGSTGEAHKIVELYFVQGLSGYQITYRTPYSKSQVYRIIESYKRGDKGGTNG